MKCVKLPPQVCDRNDGINKVGCGVDKAGSGDSNLRRSRITSSMVNLANSGNNYNQASYSNTPLGRSSDAFGGSTGNLSNRSKRLSTSSSNLSGRRTPTSIGGSASRRSNMFNQRATTPTVAFGSSVRSRPTTPTSLYPSSQRPGSVTPTKGLGSGPGSTSTPSTGPSRQRRLPSTPRTPTGQGPHGFR
ncbi:hypothetical protein PoB_002642300 [Plakobranchus ocellatus]|uniref:Uncharacterized protein n=1 Tax=Plakobranchus ocellatus TaxID=259542 RepID=A0AAV3ZYF2_9GAST|nr:hypothetical protein PoB_002642300 [Plakobranchus ocellatus]